jgi:signal transduction histidine kinase
MKAKARAGRARADQAYGPGRGGVDFGRGSGLAGLKDRIEALGGRISLHSPPGAGTTLQITLPLSGPTRAAWEG